MSLSIYDFTDYHAFLVAWFDGDASRSNRALADRLGVSRSQIGMVRSGTRPLRVEHARHWGWGLALDPNELDHWDAMVRLAHGSTDAIRRMAERQIRSARAWQDAVRETRALEAYNHWYGVVIQQMARLPDFRADGEWLGPRLVPPVDPADAQRAVDLLFEIGQLVRAEDGTVRSAQPSGRPSAQISSEAELAAEVRMHKAWLSLGLHALNLPGKERYLARVVVTMDAARVDEVMQVVRRLHDAAAEAVAEHEPTHVYEIGVAVLPRTRPDPAEGPE